MTNPTNLLTSSQAATIANVTRGTINKWCLDGDLPTIRPGLEYLIDRGDLDAFLKIPRKRPGQHDRARKREEP